MTFKQFFKYYSWTTIIFGVIYVITSGITILGVKALVAKTYDEEHEAEKTQDLN